MRDPSGNMERYQEFFEQAESTEEAIDQHAPNVSVDQRLYKQVRRIAYYQDHVRHQYGSGVALGAIEESVVHCAAALAAMRGQLGATDEYKNTYPLSSRGLAWRRLSNGF